MLSLLLSAVFSVPVVDQESIEMFVEQNRLNYGGPAEITRLAKVDLNEDGIQDLMIAFTFQWDENRHSRYYGQMVAAFVSTPFATFDATNILLVPESELIFYSEFEVEVRGSSVAVKGKKRTPDDARCCPTANGEIVFGLVKGKLKAIQGYWQYDPTLRE